MDDAQICGYYVDDNSKGISYRKLFIFVASVILSILSIIIRNKKILILDVINFVWKISLGFFGMDLTCTFQILIKTR